MCNSNSSASLGVSGSLRLAMTNWHKLSPGDTVVLLTSDKLNPRFAGRVDELSADGRYLWLVQTNGAGRRLFHHAEGYTTFLEEVLQPGQETESRDY
jgi:hypothetical protein